MTKIITHDGAFHADEVFATAILQGVFKSPEIIRTRDPEIIATGDIIYDVGLEYDGTSKFDHHQSNKPLRANETPYSSCGLIWKHFGKTFITNTAKHDYDMDIREEDVQNVFDRIDKAIFQGIDLADNGISTGTTWDVSKIISAMNPSWDSDESATYTFYRAVLLAVQILNDKLESELAIIRAGSVVMEALSERVNPKIMVLPVYCDWSALLLKMDTNKEVQFVIFPDYTDNGYRIMTVASEPNSFVPRKPLPASWAGKTPDELNAILSIDDAIFCHAGRFIAGVGSMNSVLKAAELAVQE
jgi:uncharacterized UPF0160 family protein